MLNGNINLYLILLPWTSSRHVKPIMSNMKCIIFILPCPLMWFLLIPVYVNSIISHSTQPEKIRIILNSVLFVTLNISTDPHYPLPTVSLALKYCNSLLSNIHTSLNLVNAIIHTIVVLYIAHPCLVQIPKSSIQRPLHTVPSLPSQHQLVLPPLKILSNHIEILQYVPNHNELLVLSKKCPALHTFVLFYL